MGGNYYSEITLECAKNRVHYSPHHLHSRIGAMYLGGGGGEHHIETSQMDIIKRYPISNCNGKCILFRFSYLSVVAKEFIFAAETGVVNLPL